MNEDSDEEEIEYEDEIFNIRDIEFHITTVSYLPITKLMKLHSNNNEISGQKLWCGSLVLIEYLLDNKDFIINNNIIELGSGTGLVGMLCKKLGSNNVILSDYDEKSLNHMRNDIIKNEINEINILKLDWFTFQLNQISNEFLYSSLNNLIIVAGDVLYKHILIQPFFIVIQQLLQIPRSKMLLCHVPRAGVEQIDVINAANQYGLKITSISSELWKKGVCIEYSIPEDYDRAQLYQLEAY